MAASSGIPGSDIGVRALGFLLLPGFSLMSYAAAVEPLRAANQVSGRTLYRWWNATPDNAPVAASSGASVLPDFAFGSIVDDLDIVLVCAGGNPASFAGRRTFAWLRRLARYGVTVGGISGGPVILAKAGLLAGRRCTLHWEHAPFIEEQFPDVELSGSLFEIDGDRITCAGGIAALDMMIALITRDHGHQLAAAISEWFLHTQVRQGIGPQRMELRSRFDVSDARLLATLKAMENNLEEPLSRDALAGIAGMSVRQLERIFRNQMGCGIHKHYLELRLGQAGRLLRETSLSVLEVASATGFASASQFARAFRHAFGTSPRLAAMQAFRRAGTWRQGV